MRVEYFLNLSNNQRYISEIFCLFKIVEVPDKNQILTKMLKL